jgi:hypothetical protein
MSSADNPADILSKHWAYQAIYPILKPILFFSGNTAELIPEGRLNTSAPSFVIPYLIICFAFHILLFKGLKMMGSDKIAQPHVHTYMFCPYVISTLYPRELFRWEPIKALCTIEENE